MDYPIPKHLQSFFTLTGEENSEFNATGIIHCSCNCEQFEIWESNDRNIVKLVCKQCGKEIIIFDSGKHGWDGFVCGDDYLDRSLPYKKYKCPDCGQDGFKVSVKISSQGKQDFLDECIANDDSFTPDDWVDGFEWITISVFCTTCSFKEKDWVDLETMQINIGISD